MARIVMLLANPFRPDARVLKEAAGLSKLGYEITILAWDRQAQFPDQEILANGVQIIRVKNVRSGYGIGPRQMLRLPRFWAACWTLLAKLVPDIIHCHDFDTLPSGLVWGWLHRIPVVYDAHEYYANLVKPRLKGILGNLIYHATGAAERLAAGQATAIITVDQALEAQYKQINRRVIVIGHYPPLAFTSQQAAVFAHPELIMIYSGRLSKDRGLHLMADVLVQLHAMGIPSRLVLAGAFVPAGEEQAFIAYTQSISGWIEFIGWRPFDAIPDILAQADLGLAMLLPEPRYVAAIPVKLFEYMAVGLPVIASDFPLIRQVVDDSECGWLVDPGSNPMEIAQIIARLWESPKRARQAGENGRKAVVEKYHFEILVNKLGNLYQELLSRR